VTERVVWGGRYAIYDEIASGGMATVYLAARLHVDTEVPRVVALKKLSAQFAKQPEFVAMFLDEAHLAARIRHPNVVATYECLRTDEGLGIVMDLVIGASLVSLARAGKGSMNLPPPLPITLAVITGALDGLHAAHQVSDDSGELLNLVHRDVSPHNILVGRDGVARVIDFGIAKAKGRLQVTDVGVLKGKFAYMSPEQIAGRALDRRADVYSTGIVLWESLAGRKLFRQGGNEEALLQRGDGKVAIPLPSALNPEVPAALDAIVRKALAHDPEERFRSALAMAETIRAEVAVAEPGAVAEWVHGRVGATLDVLATRRAEIEEASLRGDDEGPRRLSNPQVISLGRTSLAPRAPDSDPRSVPARVSVPPSPPVPSRRFMGDFDLAPGSASAVPLELAGRKDADTVAADALTRVGLAHRLTHLPAQLSGGEQQRVAIARAVAPGPMLLLADEPTGNLDIETGAKVMDLLFALCAAQQTTLVLITHDPALAARCGRTIRLTNGALSA